MTTIGRPGTPRRRPTGIAFTIADHRLVKNWADFNNFSVTIRLDHGSDDEEYEEVLEFRQGCNSAFCIILWRNEGAVFIQPLLGRRREVRSVAAALDSLRVAERVAETGGPAAVWPTP